MFRGIRLNAKCLADLLDRHAFEVTQHERRPLVAAQALECLRDVLLHFGAEKEPVGLWISGFDRSAHLPLLCFMNLMPVVSFARAEQIEGTVHGNAVHPRPEIRPLLKTVHLAIRPQKRFLNYIVRIVLVPRHPIRDLEDGTAVTFDQQPEGLGIPEAGAADCRQVRRHLHVEQVRLSAPETVSKLSRLRLHFQR